MSTVRSATSTRSAVTTTARAAPRYKVPYGAQLQVLASDAKQRLLLVPNKSKVLPGKAGGEVHVRGRAAGGPVGGARISQDVWLMNFKANGTSLANRGLNVSVGTTQGMTALTTAKELAKQINASGRPYQARATGTATAAVLHVKY